MSASAAKVPIAWQPLTGRGLAAFATAPLRHLLLAQVVVALLVGGGVVWALHEAWFPTIGEAIRRLPPQGELRSGRLEWAGESPVRLAAGRFLAVSVDLEHSGKLRSLAHVQVEFGRADVGFYSLFGSARRAYPLGWAVGFNQTELVPKWGAWAPAILAGAGIVTVTALMIGWWCLATAYWLPVWLAGFYANRALSVGGAWCLAGAALLPGALLMGLAVWLYGAGAMDLIRLLLAVALHLAMGWVYLVVGLVCLPPHPSVAGVRKNPFA